ncbi:MAG: acyltransferase family protein [Henriciella sp.]|nr:acyltransferase family protein [Henriciella sp.]
MQRFTILEGWRALLAWWVVLSHTLALSGFSRGDIVQNVKNSEVTGFDIGGWFMHLWYEIILLARSGKIPVYVFVMMSGFVIVHLLLMKKEPYNIYIMRRFLRLWPAE